MKKALKSSSTVLAILSLLLYQDCRLIDDESIGEVCTADCTVIQGRFTTEDKKPIPNIPLELDWKLGPPMGIGLGGKIRNIFKGTTDEHGEYKFVFYARDEELTTGRYVVSFKVEAEEFLVNPETNDFEFYEVTARDTVMIGNYHVPKKGGSLILKILNPEAITGADRISASVLIKADLDQKMFHGIGALDAPESNEVTIETACNQYSYIRIFKKLKDQYTTRLDSVFVKPNETKLYEIEF